MGREKKKKEKKSGHYGHLSFLPYKRSCFTKRSIKTDSAPLVKLFLEPKATKAD